MKSDRVALGGFGDKYLAMYGRDKRVKTVTFVVTHDCSMRCAYCYETHKSNDKMSLSTAKQAVDFLFAEDARRSQWINGEDAHGLIMDFIGGEPLLETGLIDETMTYFLRTSLEKQHRWATQYMMSICSNGLAYFDPAVQKLLHKYAGRLNINITVDGCQACHDACRFDLYGQPTYDRVTAAVKAAGLNSTKFTLAPGNLQYLYEASVNLYENLGMDTIFCNCVFEQGWEPEHARVLYREMLRLADYLLEHPGLRNTLFDDWIGQPLPSEENGNWCGGTGKMLAIDVDGRIYPCLRYTPMSVSREPYVIGDIWTGIGTTVEHRQRIAELESITRRSQSTDECFCCPVASGCAWCSAHNYEVFGTPNRRATYICPMHKARVLANAYYWDQVYKRDGEGKKFPLNLTADEIRAITGD